LITGVLAVFWPALRCDFVNYDDEVYVTSNPHVLAGITREGLVWAFRTGTTGNWHPLTWVSLMLDAQLFGRSAAGFHLVNVVLHAANTALLFILMRRLTGALWRSALVAALFALHPLHVESVAWVAERKDVLSACFFLLTLWAYARHVRQREIQESKPARGPGLAVLSFACGLMSKPMLVTLPFVLLLLDAWPLQRVSSVGPPGARKAGPAQLLLEKWPFFLLTTVFCVVTAIVQGRDGAIQSLTSFSMLSRIENAVVAYGRYVGHMFWPANLAVLYPHPAHWPLPVVLSATGVVSAISLGALWQRHRFPFGFTGWFWFLGMLVPVIGLVQVGIQSMADRYTYLPSIGILIVATWAAAAVVERWPSARPAVVLAMAIAVIGCAAQTRSQLRYWRNTGTLFEHAVAVTRDNYIAFDNLGLFYDAENRFEEARRSYERAIEINPSYLDSYYNLGVLLATHGHPEDAIRYLTRATENNSPDAYCMLGQVFTLDGRLDEAVIQFQRALEINPNYVRAWSNLGSVRARQDRMGEATECFRKAVGIDPRDFRAWVDLGRALTLQARIAEAIPALENALRLRPADPGAHYLLAWTLVKADRLDEAALHYDQVLRVKAMDPSVHFELGRVLARLGRRREAIAHLSEALRLHPDYPEARSELRKLGITE